MRIPYNKIKAILEVKYNTPAQDPQIIVNRIERCDVAVLPSLVQVICATMSASLGVSKTAEGHGWVTVGVQKLQGSDTHVVRLAE